MKEAAARIKINKLLETAGWRFFADGDLPANIRLEPSVKIKESDLDAFGSDFEKTAKGFIDFLLLEGYQKVIDGARAVVDNYRPHIPIHPNWPVVELASLLEVKPKNGYSGRSVDHTTETRVLTLSATTSGKLDLTKFKYLDEEIPPDAECRCRKGDIYLQRGNTAELVGTAALFDVDEVGFVYPDLMIRMRADQAKVDRNYLLTVLQSQLVREFLTRNATGAAGSMPKINQSIVERIPIPLPALPAQKQLVAELQAEQALVDANHELIARFEKKIQATLARVWGEDEPAVAEA